MSPQIIEKAMQFIRDEAKSSGDVIRHIWDEDLGDGSVNVKAIITTKSGKTLTVGCLLEET